MAKKKKEIKAVDRNKLLKNIEESNLKIRDIELKELIPNSIDGVVVNIVDGRHTIFLPNEFGKEKFRKWMNGRGGVFSKDIHTNNINNTDPRYVLLIDEDETFISRLIKDEELEAFSVLKLIDGKIKDKPFMILRKIQNGEKLTSTRRYIKENEEMDSNPEVINTTNIPQEDEANYSTHSLFGE